MPFTVSHAAAILPIRARWLSTSALVIGAMTPDLPLFAPFLPFTTEATHTVFATLVTNTAIGFVLFVIWHGFLARPADWFAPSAIRKRLTPVQQPGLRARLSSSGKVLVSLMIGGLTHQILDWFTHAGTPVTDRFPVFYVDVAGMPLYFFLQIALSVVGLVLLAHWAVRWFAGAEVRTLQRQPSTFGEDRCARDRFGSSSGGNRSYRVGLVPSRQLIRHLGLRGQRDPGRGNRRCERCHCGPVAREPSARGRLTHEGDVVGQSDDRNPPTTSPSTAPAPPSTADRLHAQGRMPP